MKANQKIYFLVGPNDFGGSYYTTLKKAQKEMKRQFDYVKSNLAERRISYSSDFYEKAASIKFGSIYKEEIKGWNILETIVH